MKPLLKWVGSKRWIASGVRQIMEERWDLSGHKYWEPFFGGGSVFFDIAPSDAVLIDRVQPLIEFYRVVRHSPLSVHEWCQRLVKRGADKERYEIMRSRMNQLMQEKNFGSEFAAIFVILNRLCFNGLWRQSRNGDFNVPFGKYHTVKSPYASDFVEASKLLSVARLEYTTSPSGYMEYLEEAQAGDVIFADPPYLGTYDGYDGRGNGKGQAEIDFHQDMSRFMSTMIDRGVHVIVMNSSSPIIRRYYEERFEVREIDRHQTIAPINRARAAFPQLLMISKN